jgi:hypothetical protein
LAWRGGSFRRAVTVGGAVGVVLGAMAWIDSGMLLGGIIALVITGVFYGIWMARRMARFWPGATDLTGGQRVAVVRSARRGEPIGDARLAQPVIDYGRGLHEAAESAKPFRWVIPLVLVVVIGTAIWDDLYGTWGNAVASTIYLVALPVELFWWPKRQQQLLANADRAAEFAQDAVDTAAGRPDSRSELE